MVLAKAMRGNARPGVFELTLMGLLLIGLTAAGLALISEQAADAYLDTASAILEVAPADHDPIDHTEMSALDGSLEDFTHALIIRGVEGLSLICAQDENGMTTPLILASDRTVAFEAGLDEKPRFDALDDEVVAFCRQILAIHA